MRSASLLSLGAVVAAITCGACEPPTQRSAVYPQGPVYATPGTGQPLPPPPGASAAQPAPRAPAQPAIPPPRPGSNPTRWEYVCVDGAQLNAAGALGWELVSVVPFISGGFGGIVGGNGGGGQIDTQLQFCLKRPLP